MIVPQERRGDLQSFMHDFFRLTRTRLLKAGAAFYRSDLTQSFRDAFVDPLDRLNEHPPGDDAVTAWPPGRMSASHDDQVVPTLPKSRLPMAQRPHRRVMFALAQASSMKTNRPAVDLFRAASIVFVGARCQCGPARGAGALLPVSNAAGPRVSGLASDPPDRPLDGSPHLVARRCPSIAPCKPVWPHASRFARRMGTDHQFRDSSRTRRHARSSTRAPMRKRTLPGEVISIRPEQLTVGLNGAGKSSAGPFVITTRVTRGIVAAAPASKPVQRRRRFSAAVTRVAAIKLALVTAGSRQLLEIHVVQYRPNGPCRVNPKSAQRFQQRTLRGVRPTDNHDDAIRDSAEKLSFRASENRRRIEHDKIVF
jgi:hypothetical protein